MQFPKVKRMTKSYPVRLANLLTTASIFVSFYAMISALDGEYVHAAIAIIVAAFLDAFDGRIARLTHSVTHFGEHYDSLADAVAFSVAPALLVFCWGLRDLDSIGWSVCFIFIACCCVRLARFSTNAGTEGSVHFCGMPSPAGGGFIASLIWLLETYTLPQTIALYLVAAITLITGLLMVSTLPFISSRRFMFSAARHNLINIVIGIIYFGVLIARPAETLFISGCLYIFIALGSYIKQDSKKRKSLQQAKEK